MSPWKRYKLRWRRRRYLWQAFRSRHALQPVSDNTRRIETGDILCFATIRNEALRLPYFLEHYRALGVRHFLFVDNGSTDDSLTALSAMSDVSVWQTSHGYKASRFGMDWLTWLLRTFGTGHWCVTVDADELLVYPDSDKATLPELTAYLEGRGLDAMGALMLELYPKGPVAETRYSPGQDPREVIPYFDAYGYWVQKQKRLDNLWLQGGPRARCFFATEPARAPTLNKIPLVRWRRGYVYVNSTHNALPPGLNKTYDTPGVAKPAGVLLHTKFLPDSVDRAIEERQRGEHFSNGALYDNYYRALSENPDLWCEGSLRYESLQQIEALGLMQRGGWRA